jgi:hypothetical protein
VTGMKWGKGAKQEKLRMKIRSSEDHKEEGEPALFKAEVIYCFCQQVGGGTFTLLLICRLYEPLNVEC